MSLFAELKRRNVFKVGAAYLVASWLLLQVADVLTPLLALPEWAGRLVFLILAVGFVPALIFAWAFEMTPEGLKRESEVDRSRSTAHDTGRKLDFFIIAVLVVTLGYFVVDKLRRPAAVNAQATKSIAVLPFVNMSADPDNEYFSDGLSEELLNLLARVDGLKVAARTSSFKFKNSDEDISEIAEQLGVATVLEGSVRRSGDQARITAQLIQAEDGFHLWSETYDRSLDDIFQVQDEIAGAIVEALRLPLLGVDAQPVAANSASSFEAYDLYLLGRDRLHRTTAEGFRQAIDYFNQAVELDPGFAPAYTALAWAYIYLADYGDLPQHRAHQLTADVISRAERIDPETAELFAAKGLLANDRHNYGEAMRNYREAIRRNLNDATALAYYANQFSNVELRRQAREMSTRALELDPLNPYVRFVHSRTLMSSMDEAIDFARAMIEQNSSSPFPYESLGDLFREHGQPRRATAHYRRAHELRPGDTYMANWISAQYLVLDDLEAAERWLQAAQERGTQTRWTIAAELRLLRVTGQADAYLRRLEEVLEAQPNDPEYLEMRGAFLLNEGDLAGAEASLRLALEAYGDMRDDSMWFTSTTAAAPLAALLDRRAEAEERDRLLERMDRTLEEIYAEWAENQQGDLLAAKLASIRGDREQTIEALRLAVRHGFREHWFLETDPVFARWRDDPVFTSLVREIKRTAQADENDALVTASALTGSAP